MNWEEIREFFPITKKCVYLDHGSISPLPTPVYDAVVSFLSYRYHRGRDFAAWWEKADEVRCNLAKLIGAQARDIAFTGSTSHAINIVAQGLEWQTGDNVVANDLEFPANVYPWLNLKAKGVEVRFASNINGTLPIETIAGLIDERTRLVTVSHVQATNGFRSDLKMLGDFCASRNILFLVDATQSLGAFPVDIRRLNVDFLCAAFFKWLLAPDGLGFIYCRWERLHTLNLSYLGWTGMKNRNNHHVYCVELAQAARRFELGNLNFSALYGLDAALKFILDIGVEEISKRIQELVAFLKEALRQIPGVVIESLIPENNQGGLITFDVPNREKLHA